MQKQVERTGASTRYATSAGFTIDRSEEPLASAAAIEEIIDALDEERGAVFASSYEVPGRYTRWDIGFVNPPLQLIAKGRSLSIVALNKRGEILLPEIFHDHPSWHLP